MHSAVIPRRRLGLARAALAAIADRHVAQDLFDVTAAADEAGAAARLARDALAHAPSVRGRAAVSAGSAS